MASALSRTVISDSPRAVAAENFTTPDLHEAKTRTEGLLRATHEMDVQETRPGQFLATVSHAGVGGFGIMDFGYRAGVVIRCEPPVRWVTVNFVTAGSVEFDSDGRAPIVVDPSSASVNDYTRPIRMTVSESATQSMVMISKARLESFLQNLIGRTPDRPIRFSPTIDMRREGARFAATLAMVRSYLASRPDAAIAPSLAAEYEHSLISALVLGQPNNYTSLIFAPVTPPNARVTDRVVEFIDSAVDVPFTVRELTDVAQVSERALYAAFRRDIGVSPMAYLRRVRLMRAREALLTAQEDDAAIENTVTAVAYRFGFNHVGRFAAHYRAEFGEFPSETRRSRVVAVPAPAGKCGDFRSADARRT